MDSIQMANIKGEMDYNFTTVWGLIFKLGHFESKMHGSLNETN